MKNNKGMNIDNKNIIIRGFSALIAAIAILTIVFLDASLKQDRNMGLNVSIFTIKNLVIFIVQLRFSVVAQVCCYNRDKR